MIKVIFFTVLIAAILVVVMGVYILRLRRQVKALDGNHLLWLTRKERRERARELLEREQEQYELQHQADLLDTIRGENPLNKRKAL